MTSITDALAVVACAVPACLALAIYPVPCNEGLADFTLPQFIHLSASILSVKHLGHRRSSSINCKHFPHPFFQHLLQTPRPL
ncbi:MAG TPA: hypothetical protein VJ771_05710 [Candidatus Nitrosotalea sp.]|nr:hypothetical protein [Candidatus Nitrosotalea sp.]